MKNAAITLLSVLTLILLTACAAEPGKGEAAIAWATEYTEALLEVNHAHIPTFETRADRMRKYVTEETYRYITQNRIIEIPLAIARAQSSDIVIEDLEFSSMAEQDGTYHLKYTSVLLVTLNGTEEVRALNGEVSVEEVEGSWKITRHFMNPQDLAKLVALTRPADQDTAGGAFSFMPEESAATLVEMEGARLLTTAFVLFNETQTPTRPFGIKININKKELLDLLEEETAADPYLGQQFTLHENEKHRFGATMMVREDASAEKLRALIADEYSLEVQLTDESGNVIASHWIQKFSQR